MRKISYLFIILVILAVVIVAGLHFTGYLLNNQKIIPPGSDIEWESFEDVFPDEKSDKSNNSSNNFQTNNSSKDFPLLVNLTEKLKDVPGIENINYEIFISNDTVERIIESYKDILKEQGYTYHSKYSGSRYYESSEIYYHTFNKGFNGVAIYMTIFNEQTWICYSTGSVFDYREIFEYLTKHNII